jgi:pimeloyl-ACP methyl ester carboxylesterase
MRGLVAALALAVAACGSSTPLSNATSGTGSPPPIDPQPPVDPPSLNTSPLDRATPQVVTLPASPNNAAGWRGALSHLAGTAHYDQGEWIYEDYPVTAFGAAQPGVPIVYGVLDSLGNLYDPLQRVPGGLAFVIPQAGAGPFVEEADLSELRFAIRGDELHVRARTTTMREPVRTALLLLLDTGRSGTTFAVPFGSGLTTSSADTAVLVTASGARIVDLASGDAVDAPASADATDYRNSLEAQLPLALVADASRVRFAAATGLVAPGSYELEGGGIAGPLAKVVPRFDEPVQSTHDRMQALALAAGDIDAFVTEVSITRMRAGDSEKLLPGIGYNVRTFVAPAGLGTEGGTDGTLREYGLYVPRGYTGAPAPATLILRGSSMTAHGLAAITPGLFQNLGDDNGAILVSPGGRSGFDLFQGPVYRDVLQALDDAQALMPIDPERLTIAGYSMGGYATYVFSATQPDRFAGAFVVAGPVGGNQPATSTLRFPDVVPWLDNLRYIPVEIFQGDSDSSVPITNPLAAIVQLRESGLRYRFNLLIGNSHFNPGIQNDYSIGARYLKGLQRERAPSRVRFSRSMPFERAVDTAAQTDQPAAGTSVGLAFRDAWFVHDLEAADPQDGVATIDVRTFARPQGEVTLLQNVGIDTGPLTGQAASPYQEQSWQIAQPTHEARNALDLRLTGAASVRLDLDAMDLDAVQPMLATIRNDAPVTVTFTSQDCAPIAVALVPGGHVVRLESCGFVLVEDCPGTPIAQTGKIDVGGHSLFVDIQGVAVPGQPIVVFDAGAGEDHTPWQAENVQQAIAQCALTISYDRAGRGQSDDSELPKTAAEQARQLRVLLANTGMPPPYLLVSHSIAGFNARLFADLYPEDLYGVVFVDSSHEGINEGTWQPITIVDVTSAGEMSYAEFDETVQQAQASRASDRLRDKPVSVLSATCHGRCAAGVSLVNEEGWLEFQRDLAALSDNALHTIAPPGSEHHLMTTQPQLVIDGIREILQRP